MKRIQFQYFLFFLLFIGVFQSCSAQKRKRNVQQTPEVKTAINQPKNTYPNQHQIVLPEVKREFRAAWIATVANINWPSKMGLSVGQQKSEAIQILDRLKEANFNAVIFQARPSADAFYKSDLEPWSYFLTGSIGKDPGYDPLQFWIDESHKRGMELHAWINPYRAHHPTINSVSSLSMVKKMPNDVLRLSNGTYWFDPSNESVQNHVSAVILDLVKRYDLDAIHLDDYFYPYREYHNGRDFPDSKSWNAYLALGGTRSKEDWRRANVNKFVKRMYDEIKTTKPEVKFGISPFGIWKSGYPADVTGTSQYDEIYADAKLWLNEGWVDYFAPQLYWKIAGPQNFNSLLKWWESENTKKRHLWPGLNSVGVKNVPNKSVEIANQIVSSREILSDDGQIHYSVAAIMKDWEMFNSLKNLYQEKALVPKSPWIKTATIQKPILVIQEEGSSITANWNNLGNTEIFHWILYRQYGNTWETEILEAPIMTQKIDGFKNGQKLNAVAIKAVDRLGNESEYEYKKR